MTFQPRMQNRIEGFSVVGDLSRRHWNGIVADVWNVECAPHAGGYYVGRDPRLFVLLDKRGPGSSRMRLSSGGKETVADWGLQPIAYIPADFELWAELADHRFMRHLDLHFDVETIRRRLADDLDAERLATPQLFFSDNRLLSLAHLIAAECCNPLPLHDLYGDGLSLALLIDVMKLAKVQGRKRSKLAGWQLRRATDFIEENCLRNIRLEELAGLVGLSQSHFSHAFKASTGMAPHQWQVNARLRRAKALIRRGNLSLIDIAVETGFADQAHFTRVFRKNFGTTPANWRKSNGA
ncbi:helix-turn-helix domain-containing protein [Shinella sp. AETb1-6]|jgi:AraC-like DNA-binding protein|uniref:helix-turn-helix transcriptional regulator n=1 Tax=Shinella TaxID=323620 RepID=UPI00106DECD5|nr:MULTISPECIES: AraC family transcriptional regulator [Shinella]MCD1262164.1 helix-turn-helix domain-containing protein [Shinella sumterensis]MXN51707.1 helix-turn-helix domain-containing protein [Shinella sp. AETb1-6]TFE96525.1 AraC family transcriptional regulator [Shinella sumterensis]